MPSSPKQKLSQPLTMRFEAIGTVWTIEIYEAYDRFAALDQAIKYRIEAFDKAYSRFRPDSLVSRIATQAGQYQLPDDAAALVKLYERLYELSNGAMTPLIGGALEDAGYDAAYSLQPKLLRTTPRWTDVLSYEAGILTTNKPVVLDFGAAGKGYLVDIIAALMHQSGLRHFSIDAGGDIVTVGQTLNIGLEHPDNLDQVIGVAQISRGSICGSAGNRRRWATYHHVLNPFTMTSPKHIKALWVWAASGLIADGLATALYFTSADVLRQEFDFEYAIIQEDYSLVSSPNFPARFFGAED